MELLRSKKTYIVASATIVWAVYGWLTGLISPEVAQASIFTSLQVIFLRNGIK
jgi:hypothetical protein